MSESFDIIIIGGGAASAGAALTARSRGKTVGIVANPAETSGLYKAGHITNYPGFDSISGRALALQFRMQTEAAGAKFISGRALSVTPLGGGFGVAVGNDFFMCRAVILAVGLTRESLYPGEAEFLGRGVSYCATCDGMLYRGKTAAVIGSSTEAKEDAAFLEGIGCRVLRFEENLRYEIKGDGHAEKLVAGATEYDIDCVFIIKESISVAKLVPGLDYSKAGIVTQRNMATSVPGIYAAGDCTGRPYQLAKAAGEGNVAALSACEYIDKKEK